MNIDWWEYEEDDDLASIFCEGCQKYSNVRWEDVGIGGYEYWGGRGVDHQWILVTDCCREEVKKGELGEQTFNHR